MHKRTSQLFLHPDVTLKCIVLPHLQHLSFLSAESNEGCVLKSVHLRGIPALEPNLAAAQPGGYKQSSLVLFDGLPLCCSPACSRLVLSCTRKQLGSVSVAWL